MSSATILSVQKDQEYRQAKDHLNVFPTESLRSYGESFGKATEMKEDSNLPRDRQERNRENPTEKIEAEKVESSKVQEEQREKMVGSGYKAVGTRVSSSTF